MAQQTRAFVDLETGRRRGSVIADRDQGERHQHETRRRPCRSDPARGAGHPRIERRDRSDTAAAFELVAIQHVDAISQRSHDAHTGDDHTSIGNSHDTAPDPMESTPWAF